MKRSEYREARDAHWREKGRSSATEVLVDRDVRAAEAAGVTWDPEEPEVLWGSPSWQLVADGTWRKLLKGEWVSVEFLSMHDKGPVFDELARRILEERRQQEAVDSWNDKQEKAAEEEAGAIGRTLDPPESLPGKLEVLGNPIDGLILVEGGKFQLASLADLNPKEERLLRAMVDLWNMWGPEGESRRKLVNAIIPVGWSQLRSELLAKPWSES